MDKDQKLTELGMMGRDAMAGYAKAVGETPPHFPNVKPYPGQGAKMSFKPEVRTTNIKSFAGNALRFATREEAEEYVLDLALRWTAVFETRVIESTDPVNYIWEPRYGARPIIPKKEEDNG